MVRVILAGTKTQTRRIVKSEHVEDASIWRRDDQRGLWESGIASGAPGSYGHGEYVRCPYGTGGDRLWVREAFGLAPACHDPEPGDPDDWHVIHRADADPRFEQPWLDEDGNEHRPPWKPSIHMPRWASRITLEVIGVRVERLHAITEEDARAEGVAVGELQPAIINGEPGQAAFFNARDAFAYLWAGINGAESWKSNPWVWVVEFKRIAEQAKSEAA